MSRRSSRQPIPRNSLDLPVPLTADTSGESDLPKRKRTRKRRTIVEEEEDDILQSDLSPLSSVSASARTSRANSIINKRRSSLLGSNGEEEENEGNDVSQATNRRKRKRKKRQREDSFEIVDFIPASKSSKASAIKNSQADKSTSLPSVKHERHQTASQSLSKRPKPRSSLTSASNDTQEVPSSSSNVAASEHAQPQLVSPSSPRPRPSVPPSPNVPRRSEVNASQRPKPRPSTSVVQEEYVPSTRPEVGLSNDDSNNVPLEEGEARALTGSRQQTDEQDESASISSKKQREKATITRKKKKSKPSKTQAEKVNDSNPISDSSRRLRSARQLSPIVIIIEDTPSLPPQRSSSSTSLQPMQRKRGRPGKHIETSTNNPPPPEKGKRGKQKKQQIETESASKRGKETELPPKKSVEKGRPKQNLKSKIGSTSSQPVAKSSNSASISSAANKQAIQPPKRRAPRKSLTPEPEPEEEDEMEEDDNASQSNFSNRHLSLNPMVSNTQQSTFKPSQSQRPKPRAAVDDDEVMEEESVLFETAPTGMESLRRLQDEADGEEEEENDQHSSVMAPEGEESEQVTPAMVPDEVDQLRNMEGDEIGANESTRSTPSDTSSVDETWRGEIDQAFRSLQDQLGKVSRLCSTYGDDDPDLSFEAGREVKDLMRESDALLDQISRFGREAKNDRDQKHGVEVLSDATNLFREMDMIVEGLEFETQERSSSVYESANEEQGRGSVEHSSARLFIKRNEQGDSPLNILVPLTVSGRDSLLELIRANGAQSCNKVEQCDLIVVDNDFDVRLANKTTLNIVKSGVKQTIPKSIVRKAWLEDSVCESKLLDRWDERYTISPRQFGILDSLPQSRLHVTVPQMNLQQLSMNRQIQPAGKGGNVRIAFTEIDSKQIVEHLAVTQSPWNGVNCAQELEQRFKRHTWMAYQSHLRDNLTKNKNYSERVKRYKNMTGKEFLMKQQQEMMRELLGTGGGASSSSNDQGGSTPLMPLFS